MASLLCVTLLALVSSALGRSLDPLIIGGYPANPGQYPWQASLQRYTYQDSHTCGGSLISTTWVLTAAHCIDGTNSVVMGLHQRGSAGVGAPKRYQIARKIKHYGFNPLQLTHDIGLIQLRTAVQLGNYVRTIAMATTGQNFDNAECTITGWGVTSVGGGSLATTLMAATVRAYTNNFCRSYWNIGSGHICCGVMNSRGACNGDSGGPMTCGGVLAGLTSFGTRGCYTNRPSVYTRVGFYRDWIRQISGL